MTASQNIIKESRKEWFEIVVILTACLPMLSSGLSYYWTSPFIPKIIEDKENYNITEEQASYLTVMNLIGMIILPPFQTSIVNRIGRKNALLLTSVPYIIVWILKAFCTSLWLLYLARLLSGFGDSIVFGHSYVYVGEVVSPKVRGLWGNAVMLSAFLGQLIINILGIYFTVQTTSFICIIVPIVFSIIFPFMPESPYYYISRGQYDDAKASLRKLRRVNNIEKEFENIKFGLENPQAESTSWRDLITINSNRRGLTAAVFLRLSQNFSGLLVFGIYAQFIFQNVGSNISAETSTIIYVTLNLIFYAFAPYLSSKWGRRKSLIFSLSSCSVVLIAEAIYFFIESTYPGINLAYIQWFPLAGMIGFLIFSSIGIGMIPALMLTELFSANMASKGTAVVTVTFAIFSVAVNNIFYYLNSATGLYGPFLLFGVCNFISTVVTFYIIPETKNKTLEEIQELLRKGF